MSLKTELPDRLLMESWTRTPTITLVRRSEGAMLAANLQNIVDVWGISVNENRQGSCNRCKSPAWPASLLQLVRALDSYSGSSLRG